MSHILYM